jgi:hypothetical protein
VKLATLILLPTLLFAQNQADSASTSSSARFDLHLGVAFVNGARIGARVLILENLSLEASYGGDLFKHVRFSTNDTRFSLGTN